MQHNNSFDLIIAYLKRLFSNDDIEISKLFIGGFDGANDFSYENIFRVRSINDLKKPSFTYELQWGIYESGVANISKVPNKYLGLYLSTIYLYGDRVRPMSGCCDLTNLLIFVRGILESKDQKLISMADGYLNYLNNDFKSNLISNYCYEISQLLVTISLKPSKIDKLKKIIPKIENYGCVIDDIVDVSFENHEWIEEVINSIVNFLVESPHWGFYGKTITESMKLNFGIKIEQY